MFYFRANVIMTDLPAVLPLLERNIQENMAVWSKSGGCASASELSWGEAHNLQPPDLMLLADCVYYTEVGDKHNCLCFCSLSTEFCIVESKTFYESLTFHFLVVSGASGRNNEAVIK